MEQKTRFISYNPCRQGGNDKVPDWEGEGGADVFTRRGNDEKLMNWFLENAGARAANTCVNE